MKMIRGSSNKYDKGSLTIEAAMVMPLFLFACITLLSIMDMFVSYMKTEMKLYDSARSMAVYGYAVSSADAGDTDWIRLKLVYPAGKKKILIENHVNVRVFNGFSSSAYSPAGKREEYVFVTPTGSVYHRDRKCRHLNETIRSTTGKNVGSQRNADGGRYYLCKYCGRGYSKAELSGMRLYIAEYGDRYHTRLDCSELKRTVYVIPLSKAGGRRPCKRCGGG